MTIIITHQKMTMLIPNLPCSIRVRQPGHTKKPSEQLIQTESFAWTALKINRPSTAPDQRCQQGKPYADFFRRKKSVHVQSQAVCSQLDWKLGTAALLRSALFKAFLFLVAFCAKKSFMAVNSGGRIEHMSACEQSFSRRNKDINFFLEWHSFLFSFFNPALCTINDSKRRVSNKPKKRRMKPKCSSNLKISRRETKHSHPPAQHKKKKRVINQFSRRRPHQCRPKRNRLVT